PRHRKKDALPSMQQASSYDQATPSASTAQNHTAGGKGGDAPMSQEPHGNSSSKTPAGEGGPEARGKYIPSSTAPSTATNPSQAALSQTSPGATATSHVSSEDTKNTKIELETKPGTYAPHEVQTEPRENRANSKLASTSILPALSAPAPPPPPPASITSAMTPPRDAIADSLYFSDFADVVWDPRPPPRRKVGEAGAGTEAEDGPEALAEAKALWQRDSDLLQRVAPVHAEKAMQVLQACRHDIERASQVLTVRHGIQVHGMPVTRTTRRSQWAPPTPLPLPCTIPARLQPPTEPPHVHSTRRPTPGMAEAGGGEGRGGWAGPRAGFRVMVDRPDAEGYTREEVKQATEAFMRCGRDLVAVAAALGWQRSRVVEYYYRVWKFSPAYQVWKATRHQVGLPSARGTSGKSG
ncbi:unnamed protein product, partial [Discosporangium mesarthrocarpum]